MSLCSAWLKLPASALKDFVASGWVGWWVLVVLKVNLVMDFGYSLLPWPSQTI